jgi:hypothetical protein
MDIATFIKSIEGNQPPQELPLCLKALWYDAKGDWHTAHSSIDSAEDMDAYWVHAYLHRKEGDAWNAGYWYRRAGKTMPNISLDQEWKAITTALL